MKVGRVCTLHWSSKLSRRQCFFYFKLKDQFIIENKSKHQEYFAEEWEEINVDKGFLDKLSDINHNPENGCKLLQVFLFFKHPKTKLPCKFASRIPQAILKINE